MNTEDMKIDRREVFTQGCVNIREEKDSTPTIEGVAIVTERETVLFETDSYREVEVIAASCLNEAFVKAQDIKLNLLHERRDTIARTPNSLQAEVKPDGLHFRADIPDCDLGKRAMALIGNGTYTGCSFEFRAKDYTVTERKSRDGKTEYVIRHTTFANISAITIAMDPAYKDTSVKLRELYEAECAAQEDPTNDSQREAEVQQEADKQRNMQMRDQQIASVRRKTILLNQMYN